MTAPTFMLQEIVVLEAAARRDLQVTFPTATLKIDYSVVSASFNAGTPLVLVETQYRIDIVPEPSDGVNAAEPFATLTTRLAVSIIADRNLTEEEGLDGTLDPAQGLANRSGHPYHRQLLRSWASDLGLPPFEFPIDFSLVEANLKQRADA
ncbi:MAG: hypothetical protein JWN70_2580 [Planctomycetaceae bacterium]|nr:hypothetical protein [Planctomycetaceae bacterium]